MANKKATHPSAPKRPLTSKDDVKAYNLQTGDDICIRDGSTEFGLDLKTKPPTKLYPSVECNATSMAETAECAPDLADAIYAWGDSGYWLINGTLVPRSFLDRVEDALKNTLLTYGAVVKVESLFPTSFLTALDRTEQTVLGPLALMLIENGGLDIHFPTPVKRAA